MSDAHADLCRRLDYRFAEARHLERALTHRSHGADHNERMEFLGDGLLNFIIADVLYHRYPALTEGELTRLRARLVRQDTLAALARGLALGDCLHLGGGELKSGGYDRDSILADALEAVLAAVLLDGGFEPARRVILGVYADWLDRLEPSSGLKDPKTALQEYLQKQGVGLPCYHLLEVTGEPHAQRFLVECAATGLPKPVRGEGTSRRAAEQEAAARALERLAGKAGGRAP